MLVGFGDCLNLCGDWTQYKDIKCLIVIEKRATEEEALHSCSQIEQSSTLLTIHSKDEQEFNNNLLGKYKNISLNAWIGMKYTDKVYKWMDGTDTNFTNWADDTVRDGTDPCVQMSLVTETLGKWSDMSCKKLGIIVCQKKQEFNFTTLRNAFELQQKDMNSIKDEIKALNQKFEASIPLGFLYTQFPNQSKPEDLWPNTTWSEITSNYSGLFFRAEGGESEPFGQVQQANQSWISDIHFFGVIDSSFRGGTGYETEISLKKNQFVDLNVNAHEAVSDIRFYTTGGEVRPKNTAIKIWKRIQ